MLKTISEVSEHNHFLMKQMDLAYGQLETMITRREQQAYAQKIA